jgi:hypothetical protein
MYAGAMGKLSLQIDSPFGHREAGDHIRRAVIPAATESIMGSLPRAKAGVGSAVNDTTRPVGGAPDAAVRARS